MKRLAYFFSRLFDPGILYAFLVLLTISFSSLSFGAKLVWGVIFEFLVIILPLIFFYWQLKKGVISDIDITKRQERQSLFRFVTLVWLISLILAITFALPKDLMVILAIGFFIIAVWTLITPYFKISAHIAGATSFVLITYLIFDLKFMLWLGPIFIIFIGWIRFVQNKHTLWQIFFALIISAIIVWTITNLLI